MTVNHRDRGFGVLIRVFRDAGVGFFLTINEESLKSALC
jgi:hypothetical protein